MVKINQIELKNRTIIAEDYFVFLLIKVLSNFIVILLTKVFGFVLFFPENMKFRRDKYLVINDAIVIKSNYYF